MDSRAIAQARHLSPRVLITQGAQGHHRIDLSETCPLGSADADVAVVAPQGWVCGAENEFVRIAGRVCAIGSVTAIDAREYAQLTRQSDGASIRGVATLDAVEVRPDARRRFAASHEYCVDPRQVRGWNVENGGVIVNTSSRRSGGNSWYRLELGRSCPELEMSRSMVLHSGVGIGWICGNAGDAVVAQGHYFGGSGFAEPAINSMLASRSGCPVTAVYPIDQLAGR